jgi:hypothetical protein
MNVDIANYPKIFKCSNLKARCPDICYNKKKCKKTKCKCRCLNIQKRRNMLRCKAQKNLTVLSNDRNTQRIRNGKQPNYFCTYQKPDYSADKDKQDYYNAVYRKVYNSIATNYLPKRDNRKRINKKMLREYAIQYTVMWLRKFASSQGPTADGWPATSLNGDNRNHFSEVQDGYASNCCYKLRNKKGKLTREAQVVRGALNNPRQFCRITRGSCSGVNCRALKKIYNLKRRGKLN